MTFQGLKPYTPSFDGSDTKDLVAQFMEKGGKIDKCPTHKKSTGEMRFRQNPTRKEAS